MYHLHGMCIRIMYMYEDMNETLIRADDTMGTKQLNKG